MAKKKVETKVRQKTPAKITKAVTATEAPDEATKVRTIKVPVASPQTTHAALRKWNLILAAVFAVQAGLVLVFNNGRSVPVMGSYPAVDTLASEASKHDVYTTAMRQLFDMPIAYLLAASLLVFALTHLLVATRYQRQFEAVLDRGVHTARWLMFGVGGIFLFDAIYLLSGINDLLTIKLLGAALLGACVSALAVELLGPGRPGLSRLLMVIAVISGLLPWVALAKGLVGAWMLDGTVPSYLSGVYASGFILVVGIALATYFRWQRRGRWANTLYSEKMFMLLGLATVTVLVWQIFVGALL